MADRHLGQVRKPPEQHEVVQVEIVPRAVARFSASALGRRVHVESGPSPHLLGLLRAGSLAAPMDIVEERVIGPSLGQDNIDAGRKAVIVGFIAIILFMGLWNMFKGGDPNLSQKLMRARVIAQAVAIVVILAALYFFGRGS